MRRVWWTWKRGYEVPLNKGREELRCCLMSDERGWREPGITVATVSAGMICGVGFRRIPMKNPPVKRCGGGNADSEWIACAANPADQESLFFHGFRTCFSTCPRSKYRRLLLAILPATHRPFGFHQFLLISRTMSSILPNTPSACGRHSSFTFLCGFAVTGRVVVRAQSEGDNQVGIKRAAASKRASLPPR